jgi:hypothetical protein
VIDGMRLPSGAGYGEFKKHFFPVVTQTARNSDFGSQISFAAFFWIHRATLKIDLRHLESD